MRAVPVTGPVVIRALYAIQPYSPHHGEVSEAIAQAANGDPLFPQREDGCFRTAAILVALAYCASVTFDPSLVHENGKAFGLYAIRPPSADALGRTVSTNMLTNVRDASVVAIDLVRSSMLRAGSATEDGLMDFFALGNNESDPLRDMKKSMERMLLADTIFQRHLAPHMPGGNPMLPAPKVVEPKQLGNGQ